jgi:hypothetical protein
MLVVPQIYAARLPTQISQKAFANLRREFRHSPFNSLQNMTGPSKPIGIRRKPRIQYGRRTIRIVVAGQTSFTLAQDLLCSKSVFFAKELQPKRKSIQEPDNDHDIPEDKECPICLHPLGLGVQELTYCNAGCGQNFHLTCLSRWIRKKGTCPFCRCTWAGGEEDTVKVLQYPGIDATAFEVFIEWCVYEHVAVEDTEEDGTPDFRSLVQAYALGVYLKHSTFCKAVLGACLEVIKKANVVPDAGTVALAYDKTAKGSPLRSLLVDVYAYAGEKVDVNALPEDFVQDMVVALPQQRLGSA